MNVLTSVAQWERETISKRVKEALPHLRAQGVPLGGVACGWHRCEQRDESEAGAVRRILELRQKGETFRAIASVLEAEGHATKKGGSWRASTVHGVWRRATA